MQENVADPQLSQVVYRILFPLVNITDNELGEWTSKADVPDGVDGRIEEWVWVA